MNGAFYVGAVGLDAQQRALDLIAGNIANINTQGFKRSGVRFSQVLAKQPDADMPAAYLNYVPMTASVAVEAAPTMDIAGPLEASGSAMDLAIDGRGFIELMGPDGQTMLWRGGALHVGDDGLLAAPNGMALKAAITIPADAGAVSISRDGVVQATGVNESALPIELGRISLVRIEDGTTPIAEDAGVYRVDEEARLVDAQPGEDGMGVLVQGSIERSNVEMTNEMVELMLVQRAYGANAQLVQAADQLMAIANGLRR